MRSLNVAERDPLEDLEVYGRIILRLTLKTASEGANWLIGLRVGQVADY
jgi:hypothetical protein